MILLIGNYLNTGSRNEQSLGFDMNFLTKVSVSVISQLKKEYIITQTCVVYIIFLLFINVSALCLNQLIHVGSDMELSFHIQFY